MGVRMPGATTGAFSPKMVEALIEAEKIPVEKAKEKKQEFVAKRDEFQKLSGLVTDLDSSLNGLKTKTDFFKMKAESTHPDIIDGTIKGIALPGTYEFEVRNLARAEKELAYGFPDKDQTPVGFGFMMIERQNADPLEITIEPGATLKDVAQQINDADAGVRAMVINTKYSPDAYRLLVVSDKTGAESRIMIDEDTTFLEFKEQVTGRNLDILFEDVPVMDDNNTLDELVEGVVFNAKRAEPGTRVQVNITHDPEATLEGIKGFVEKYNAVLGYIHDQHQLGEDKQFVGVLGGDGALKTIQRSLQSSVGTSVNTGGKYHTLADVGITTDPQSGKLNMDESKVKAALAEDYESVAKLFIKTPSTSGLADRMGANLKGLRDPTSGVLKSRIKGLDDVIKNQDENIKRRERTMQQREENIKRRFTALENQLSNINAQGNYLTARLGNAGGGGGGQ